MLTNLSKNKLLRLILSGAVTLSAFSCSKEEEAEEEEKAAATKTSSTDDGDEDEDEDADDEGVLEVSLETGTSYHRSSSSTPLAQSFTTTAALSLSKVSLFISNTNGVRAGSISVIITQGGASPAAGTRVSSWVETVSTHATGATGWVDFEFTTPVELSASTVYWIEAWPGTSAPCDFMEDITAPYSGGQMLRMDSMTSNWVSSQEGGQPVLGDMKFRVYSAGE